MAIVPHLRPSRLRRVTPALWPIALMLLAGCRVTDVQIWRPAESTTAGSLPVREVRGLAYDEEVKGDPARHKLDIFLPRDRKDFPVVVLVHGGAWVIGDNRCCGLYSSVGHFLASQGIGAVLPNYRLSPEVKHPEHVKDVARALAWTQAHIGEYGGDTRRMYLVGHSAGGHLVSLLATDPSYLEDAGFKMSSIKGVVSISGVYKVPPGQQKIEIGGSSPLAVRWDQMLPLIGDGSKANPDEKALRGIPTSINVYGPAFGSDPEARIQASPITHVRPGLPPFLLINADKDLPTLPTMAAEFQRALEREGCDVKRLVIEKRNHNSIMFTATRPDEPVAHAILEFVNKY